MEVTEKAQNGGHRKRLKMEVTEKGSKWRRQQRLKMEATKAQMEDVDHVIAHVMFLTCSACYV